MEEPPAVVVEQVEFEVPVFEAVGSPAAVEPVVPQAERYLYAVVQVDPEIVPFSFVHFAVAAAEGLPVAVVQVAWVVQGFELEVPGFLACDDHSLAEPVEPAELIVAAEAFFLFAVAVPGCGDPIALRVELFVGHCYSYWG